MKSSKSERSSSVAPSAPSSGASFAPLPDAVSARAYELWEKSGSTHGRDQEHWFQAEQELQRRDQDRSPSQENL